MAKEFAKKPEKFILDATAGFRMMWFNKQHSNAIFMDERDDNELRLDAEQFGKNRGRPLFKEWNPTNPTVQGDYRKVNFSNNFRLIIWDPPHLFSSGSKKHQQRLCFGSLHAETWQSDLTKGFLALWQQLAPWGILIFKWHDSAISHKDILKLFDIRPLFGQITTNRKVKKKNIHTYWFCFMKIPENEKGLANK